MYATILNKIAEYQQSIEQLKTYLENTAIQQLIKIEDPQFELKEHTFGFAVNFMKLGYAVTRKPWENKKFLLPPIFNLGMEDKIPSRIIQMVNAAGINRADYRNVYFTISLQGIYTLSTYLPWEDLTATDWEIAY